MLKALVPVDGSENSLSAVRHVIRLVQDREPLDVHLINVQPPMHGDVTAFVSTASVHDFQREQGHKAMAAACAMLDEAGIAYTKHIFVGHPAEMIADRAHTWRCDKVIMGTHGYGTITQLLLGSISHEVIHRLDPRIPVTLVKTGYVDAPHAAEGMAP
jgi:nucleotide-binding universal stress UspA family protein